jgi:opacity protein-like surface antigen
VGAGAEFAVTQNWMLRGEFLYLDFLEGTSTLVLFLLELPVRISQAAIRRVGLSYKLSAYEWFDMT